MHMFDQNSLTYLLLRSYLFLQQSILLLPQQKKKGTLQCSSSSQVSRTEERVHFLWCATFQASCHVTWNKALTQSDSYLMNVYLMSKMLLWLVATSPLLWLLYWLVEQLLHSALSIILLNHIFSTFPLFVSLAHLCVCSRTKLKILYLYQFLSDSPFEWLWGQAGMHTQENMLNRLFLAALLLVISKNNMFILQYLTWHTHTHMRVYEDVTNFFWRQVFSFSINTKIYNKVNVPNELLLFGLPNFLNFTIK